MHPTLLHTDVGFTLRRTINQKTEAGTSLLDVFGDQLWSHGWK